MNPARVGLGVALAALALGAAAAGPADGSAPRASAAPRYGQALFDFYQDKAFAALTGLAAAQPLARIDRRDDETEALRGGMLLAWGMPREAEEILARLAERGTVPGARDRAWFLLAKARQQRGLIDQAEEALARIAAPLPGALEEDRQMLRAQLLMQRQDWARAAIVLDAVQAQPGASLFARFNLAVALVNTGTPAGLARGRALLESVGTASAPDETLRSLRDRANLALGLAALEAHKPREAREALQRVRLDGVESNKALLAYGWAAIDLNDPKLALAPWTELAARPRTDEAVLEARIAAPYALGELGAYSQALRGYQQAAEGFEREQQALSQAISAIRVGALFTALLAANSERGLDTSAGITALPDLPQAAQIAPLLAGNAFQQAFRSLRDLRFLDLELERWQASLATYTDLLSLRRRAFADRLPAQRAQALSAEIDTQQRRRDALAEDLRRAEAQGDALAFADPHERELLARMGRLLGELASMQDPAAQAATGARLRRAAAALTWQRTQAFPARMAQAKEELRTADAALANARRRHAALEQAQRDEPARQQAFATRIADLTQRLAVLRPALAALASDQHKQLQDLAVVELQRQQERLAAYAAQARLAMAQIYDNAQFARGTEPGAQRPSSSTVAPP